ncbi:SRPBCC family protein [Pseudonocardia nematodicida]|uniref:SRPBCC family protein n=1 Tax=Pseudonocardia nematodicida TaxID=1206997 RepID=A0ABV1KHG7_9PSEU
MSTHVTFDDADGPVLHFARRYPHPVDRVWAALTEPGQMSRWFPCEVEIDLRVGGVITLTFPGGEQDTAEITELDPPATLAFTWAGERLRWTLQPEGDGCVLRLDNTVLDRDTTGGTAAGWDRCFEALATHLDGADVSSHAGPDEALIAHYRTVLSAGPDT